MKEKDLQWHPAFFASLQIELAEEKENLIFENEHLLGTKPTQIDVLIVKKEKDVPIRKNIGRIFRKHNIIEYKSPKDYLSIDDFYKVYGYACLYKCDADGVNQILIEDITITFVSKKYPYKMIKHLQQIKKYHIIQRERGIYDIIGDTIQIQLIVTKELAEEENLWLHSLTDELKDERAAERLAKEYGKYRENKLYESVMNIVVRANQKEFQEVRDMCEALEELMADKIKEKEMKAVERGMAKGMAKGMEQGLAQGMSQGMAQGIECGIEALVLDNLEENISKERIVSKLQRHFQLQEEQAEQYFEKYAKVEA